MIICFSSFSNSQLLFSCLSLWHGECHEQKAHQ